MPVRPPIDTTYSQVWDVRTNVPSMTMVKRDIDGAFIPFDPANLDYRDYQAWLDAGNEPTPYTPPPAAKTE
jgi:hypothetical protein